LNGGCAALLVGLSKGGLLAIGMLYRRDYSAAKLRILIPAGIVGVLVGWLTASVVSDTAIMFMIGVVGVAFFLNVWLRKQGHAPAQPAHTAKGWFWGSLAGFTSFISHASAPPFQVYMLPQKLSKMAFAGTATIFFAVINAAKILPHQNLQTYSGETLWSAAVLISFALVGTIVGAYLTRRVADVWFYRIAQSQPGLT
jgi:uncharacterized protein